MQGGEYGFQAFQVFARKVSEIEQVGRKFIVATFAGVVFTGLDLCPFLGNFVCRVSYLCDKAFQPGLPGFLLKLPTVRLHRFRFIVGGTEERPA